MQIQVQPESAIAQRLWSANRQLSLNLTELEADNQRLRQLLVEITDMSLCEKLTAELMLADDALEQADVQIAELRAQLEVKQ